MEFDWITIVRDGIGLGLMGYLIHRLTSHIDKSDARNEKMVEEMLHIHERIDVNDRVTSSFTKAPYNSAQVAKGLQPYPVVHERRT